MSPLTMQGPLPAPWTPTSVDQWITPQEHLGRLALSVAKERVLTNGLRELPDDLVTTVAECAALLILRRSDLSSSDGEIPSLQDLAVAHLVELSPLPSSLTNWYTARKRLNNLPEKLPPLPENIYAILNEKCPIYGDQIKEDGTRPRVGETHFLQLICEEDGSLNRFENVVKNYGKTHYTREGYSLENPLQFRKFRRESREEHGDTPFETHWELITKDVIPGSRDKTYDEQVSIVAALAQKAFANYEIPLLSMVNSLFLHKIATEDSLSICSHVQEITRDCHLFAGAFTLSGLFVTYRKNECDYGVGACRRF